MPLRIQSNAEPIPGYRLIEKLGSGGFGEVWKAEAPGGLFKAIKFVQRSNSPGDGVAGMSEADRSRAEQEWKSLGRVKTVRHPFIVLLDRYEIIDDYLVIVMELADRTLADRFKECRSQGLPGLPREELLGYMAEAAEVLDLMSTQYQLQHLDIKPQNLFLVHNHIKVADFGLVKDTTEGAKLMTITGGVTPVYAAPETFDGKFSRQSDQYSLAIVYHEMLTGHRPFTGTSMKQLILQHMQYAFDLNPAPVNDRPVLARALSRNPEDRYPSCVELVNALRRATAPEVEVVVGNAPIPPEALSPLGNRTIAARGGAGPVKAADPNFNVEQAFFGTPRESGNTPVRVPSPEAAPRPTSAGGSGVLHSTTPGTRRRKSERPSAPELPGVVQPALVIGIGQLGVETILQFKQRLATEFAGAESFPHLRLVAIDTDPGALQQATTTGAHPLHNHETFLARLQRPSHYLKTRDGKLPTDRWLNAKLLYRIPREQNGAGARALGRLAFVDNYRAIARRLETELLATTSQDTPHDPSPYSDLGLRTAKPRVYVVTSLTGNTGSGMMIDVAYLVRKLLNDQGHSDAEVVGVFLAPAVRRESAWLPSLGNTFAALQELRAFSLPDTVFTADYETSTSPGKGESLLETGPAFQRCMLFTLPDKNAKITPEENARVTARVGDFLYRDVATMLGQALDEARVGLVQPEESWPRETMIESCGMYRIHWPRQAVLEKAARELCTRLATRWMSKDVTAFADTIRQWTHERWESLGMRPENLIERFQSMAEHSLHQSPEHMLAEILAPLHQAMSAMPREPVKGKPAPPVNMTPVIASMDRLEKVLGIADEARTAKQAHVEPGVLERALADIAHVIADQCEQKLAELAVTLLEDPNYRLAGAEEALRQFAAVVDRSLQSQEPLAKELSEKAAQLSLRIHQMTEGPSQNATASNTHWALGNAKRGPANAPTPDDVFELVRTYTKTRYHSMVLTHLNRLYLALRGHLSDQIREVGFCRQRLGELQRLLQPLQSADINPMTGERALFPVGCLDVKDAVEQVLRSITADDMLTLDDRVQEWIRTHCQALLQICMGSSTLVRSLAPAMQLEAERFLKERMAGASVADMYWSQKHRKLEGTAEDQIAEDLQNCVEHATAEPSKPGDHGVLLIASFPRDPHGERLQSILHSREPGVRPLLVDRPDEIVFFQEATNLDWRDLPQLGPFPQEIYQQRMSIDPSALHSREDVLAWHPTSLRS